MKNVELIYQDADLIVVSKPAGMPVHEIVRWSSPQSKRSDDYTLVDWLLEKFPETKDVGDLPAAAFREEGSVHGLPYRPGIVQRLDKQTSGVMVIARNQESFLRLKEIFKSRSIEKIYTALVCKPMKEKNGVIDKPLGRLAKSPTKVGIESPKGKIKNAKEAVTEFRVVKNFAETALLEVKPKTGRMHQIRVHLASIGHPVAGDLVYGGKNVCLKELGRYFLHASSLSFSFREGQRLTFSADLPEELENALAGQTLA